MCANEQGSVVVRDEDRFRLLFTNSRPVIPKDYKAPLCLKTTRQLIAERISASTSGADNK